MDPRCGFQDGQMYEIVFDFTLNPIPAGAAGFRLLPRQPLSDQYIYMTYAVRGRTEFELPEDDNRLRPRAQLFLSDVQQSSAPFDIRLHYGTAERPQVWPGLGIPLWGQQQIRYDVWNPTLGNLTGYLVWYTRRYHVLGPTVQALAEVLRAICEGRDPDQQLARPLVSLLGREGRPDGLLYEWVFPWELSISQMAQVLPSSQLSKGWSYRFWGAKAEFGAGLGQAQLVIADVGQMMGREPTDLLHGSAGRPLLFGEGGICVAPQEGVRYDAINDGLARLDGDLVWTGKRYPTGSHVAQRMLATLLAMREAA